MHDIFISYSFDDQQQVEYIANRLSSRYGITYWLCTREIRGGQHYKRMIAEAIKDAGAVVLFYSTNAADSREIPKEVSIAFDKEKMIIPFRLDKAEFCGDLYYDLVGVEYIDGTKPEFEERIDDLARSINEALGRHAGKAPEKAQPVLKSVGAMPSQIFYGRDEVLADIHEAFSRRNLVFLRGMGGIGKSEIAKQYAERERGFYSTVVFARYEDDLAALIADDTVFCVEGAGRKTKPDNTMQSDREYALDKLEILKKHCDAHTLIIIDNYDVNNDPFMEDLAQGAEYRVLVTTRCAQERGKYHIIQIGELDDETLKDMVIDYADPETTMIDRDDPAFDELLDLSNRHTLTLELIAKYMDEKCIDDVGEMVGLLKKDRLSVLSDSETRDGFAVVRDLFRLTKLSEAERDFLRCLALMPADGVDQRMFRQWMGDGFKVRSRLAGLSLVKIDSGSRISLHSIVRDVIVSELKPDYTNCREFIDRIAMLHEDYIPMMWELKYEKKLVFLDCYASILKFVSEVTEETFPLYLCFSTMFNYIGEYSDAIGILDKMYAFACGHYGEQSKEAMMVLNNIGWKNANCNFPEKALTCYRRTAEYFIANPDYTSRSAHFTIQCCVRELLMCHKTKKDPQLLVMAQAYLEKFIQYGKKMLEIAEAQGNPETYYMQYQLECVSRTYITLYIEMGDYDKAGEALEAYYDVLQRFRDKPNISYDIDMSSWYHHCGLLMRMRGEYAKAAEALKKAYEGYVEHFSMRNLSILDILELLAVCMVELGEFEEARKYIEQALDIAGKLYVEAHPTYMRLTVLRKRITGMA